MCEKGGLYQEKRPGAYLPKSSAVKNLILNPEEGKKAAPGATSRCTCHTYCKTRARGTLASRVVTQMPVFQRGNVLAVP